MRVFMMDSCLLFVFGPVASETGFERRPGATLLDQEKYGTSGACRRSGAGPIVASSTLDAARIREFSGR
jgi:hypothetical protein